MAAPDRPPTREEKLACIKRELGYRRRVYEHRVQSALSEAEKAKRQASADKEIWLMEAIQQDYEASTDGLLF